MKKSIIIDAPTWSYILPALLAVYQHGTPKGRDIALEELKRMAEMADRYAPERPDIKIVESEDHD